MPKGKPIYYCSYTQSVDSAYCNNICNCTTIKTLGNVLLFLCNNSGHSTLRFSVMDTSDGGKYSCGARNHLGETTKTYVLKVKTSLTMPPGGSTGPEVTVTVKPNNESIEVGKPASLICNVKSVLLPRYVMNIQFVNYVTL